MLIPYLDQLISQLDQSLPEHPVESDLARTQIFGSTATLMRLRKSEKVLRTSSFLWGASTTTKNHCCNGFERIALKAWQTQLPRQMRDEEAFSLALKLLREDQVWTDWACVYAIHRAKVAEDSEKQRYWLNEVVQQQNQAEKLSRLRISLEFEGPREIRSDKPEHQKYPNQ